MLSNSRSKFARCLALALLAAASVLPAPAAAARLVKNIATASHVAAVTRLVSSNEVTVEIGAAQFTISVTSSAGQVAPGQDVRFSVHVENNGNLPAPASDQYILDGAAATGAFALTAVPAGSVLSSVQGVTLYHYAGEAAGVFHSAPPAQLSQVDAVGVLLSGLAAGGKLDYSYTVRPRNSAEAYSGGVTLLVPPTANLGGVAPAWIQASPPAKAKVVGAAASLTVYTDPATTHVAPYLMLGATGYLKLVAQACNTDPTVADTRTATVTTDGGDSETLLATETAPDSNVFTLAPLPTRRGQPQAASGSIESLQSGTVTVSIQGCFAPISVDFQLIDPSGIVFDSVTNAPVDDVDVTLFKASGSSCTSTPAAVQVPDGTGVLVSSPNPYRSRDGGRYQFPLVAAGSYCLQVASSVAHSFPTTKALSRFSPERRLGPGSLGLPFPLGPEPVPVILDLPVDPPSASLDLFVNKKASRDVVQVGEQLQFTVQVKNVGAKAVSHLQLRDAMSIGLSYMAGTLRINDTAAADPVAAAGTLSMPLPDLAAGKTHTISYRTAVSPSAPSSVQNAASATADEGKSNTANVRVEVRRGFETDSKGVLTGTVYLACQADNPSANPGVPGVRLLLEDGTGVITDNLGRYSRYGLRSGTHVLKIDPTSLPEFARVVASDSEGSAGLSFIDLKDGELFKRNFALECTEEAQEQVKERAAKPVVDEVFRALDRTFSAAVTMPGIGGASSLSSTGTGSARDLPAPGVRDAFGTPRDFSAANERNGAAQRSAPGAVTSIASAADVATALETALLGVGDDNKAAFLNLQDDQVLPASTISVQVKAPLDSKLVLSLNGVPLDESRIGQRSIYRDKAVMGFEYVGIKLTPGSNLLELEQKDQFGNVRGKAGVRVRAPGDLAQISFAPVAGPLYAGEGGPAMVRIRLLDAEGVPVTARLPVSLETETGKWLTPDAGARGGEAQLFIEGGQADVAITRPVQAMRIRVTATSGKVTSNETLDFVPQLRPFIAAGVAEALIRVSSGQALTVVPTTSLDAFSRELQGLSRQFGKGEVGARLAVFLKGKVKGDYLLTLSYDSDKPTRERLFRDISPDEFYPVYGDNSTRTFDAQSASRLYVRIEKDHSWALVGDFITQPQASSAPKPVLSSYTRPVTGVATHLEEGGFVVDAFALRDTSLQQVFEFEPNGTSGPYSLPSGNLLANSERVELVVRDRFAPAIIISRTTLTRFDDYELEALSGRVLFKAPVSHFDASQNLVSVRVTFEVESGQAAFNTFGGQISTRLGDSATVAVRAVREANPASPYTVQGVLAQVDVTPKLKVSAELARTQRGNEDGPLSGTGGRVEVKGVIAGVELNATATATSKNYDNLSSGISPNRRDVALSASLPLGEDSRLVARMTAGKDTLTGALSEVAYAGVETPLTSKLRLEAGVRRLKEDAAVFAGATTIADNAHQQATTVRAKLSAQMESLPELTGSVEAEQSLDGGGREAAVAVNYQLSSGTKIYARHELVNTLPVLSSASISRQTTAIGVDTAYSTSGRAFAELRQTTTQGLSGPAAAYGVRESWEPFRGVRLTGGVEKVQVMGGPADLDKTTNSMAVTSAVDVNIADDWRANGRVERATGSAENSWLVTAGLAYKLSPAWTALARQVYYQTQATTADSPVRVQSRLQLGMAWRSVEQDALLLLERTTEPLDPGDRDSAIVSAQYGRALTTSLRLSTRLAGRQSVERSAGLTNRSYAALAGGRLSYEVTGKWNLGLQAQVVAGNGSRSAGTGLEVGYRVSNGFWVVAGYNWMAATDPVLQGQQFSHGAYIRIRYMFDESVLDAFPRMDAQ